MRKVAGPHPAGQGVCNYLNASRMEHSGHQFRSGGKTSDRALLARTKADREAAIALVRKGVALNEGELAEAAAEVSGREFVGLGMRPGDVRRLGRRSDLDEV
jgi:hypothetical protein